VDVKINDITEVEKELAVEVTAEELTPHIEKAYKRAQKDFDLKGFRKGKVPVEMLKRLYGEQIENASLDDITTNLYREVAQVHNLRPVGEPTLTDIQYKRGESLAFKIKYEVMPEITLKEYKGIRLEKLIHTVTDREIEAEITRIRRANAAFIETQSADDDEHIVTVDVQELDGTDFPMIGRKSENQRIYLADETLVPELKEALRNAAVGSSPRVRYESQHGDHKHQTNIQVTVKKIEKIQLPDFDDALVQKITKGKTHVVQDFREQLRKDIEQYWQDRSDRKLESDLIGEIVRRHDFVVPEALVKGIVTSQLQDMQTRFPNQKLPADFDEQKFREDVHPSAVFQAKWLLLREIILKEEGIKVDDAELEKFAKDKAQQTGIEESKLVDFFKQSEETQRRLVSDKLMALLKSHAKISEKVTEEAF
jgi:trigger factor